VIVAGRYNPLRLWTTTVHLAKPDSPLLLPPSSVSGKMRMAVPFDLRLPGWLPPTHSSEMTITAYGLVVRAVLGWASPAPAAALAPHSHSHSHSHSASITGSRIRTHSPSSSIDSTRHAPTPPQVESEAQCSGPVRPRPIRSRSRHNFDTLFPFAASASTRTIETATSRYTEFTIRRHRHPRSVGAVGDQIRQFAIKPTNGVDCPVECFVTLPDWVDVHSQDRTIKIAISLRAWKEGSTVEDKKQGQAEDEVMIQMHELGMHVEEVERVQ
jgi:hypothetical protein